MSCKDAKVCYWPPIIGAEISNIRKEVPTRGSSYWPALRSDGFMQVLIQKSMHGLAPRMRLTCKGWRESVDTNITELKPSDARCCHKFVSLKILDLSYCSDSVDDATLHDVIINCSRIESLVLSFCHRITDSGIRSVSRLSHLSSLEVADCKLLQDGSLRVLQESVCPLTSIDLTGCDGISAAALEAFLTCCAGRKLRILSLADFSQFTVRDMTLEQIGTMKCLTSLNLANTLGFGDTGMLALAELPMLTHLDMCGCDQISGDSLKNLNGLTGLKFLNLSATRISDGPLRSILAKATSVCSLHISSCEYLSHTTLVELPAAAPGLRELVVANNTFVSDTGVTALARLANLQKLDLSYCVALTDCCVAPLTCLSLLEELSLAGCLWVTCSGTASSPTPNSSECSGDSKRQHSTRVDTGQATLGIHWSKLTRLRSLDMSGSGLCVPGLRGMQHLRNLEVLDISDCQDINPEAIAELFPSDFAVRIYADGWPLANTCL